jgi:hypothetical protein
MRAKSLLAVAVFVAIGATACGSSSKNSTGSVTSAPGSTTASTTGPSGSGTTTTTTKLSGSSSSDFCDLARADEKAFSGANAASLSSENLKKDFANLGPALQHAADVAPKAIKSDFEVFINAFKPYLKALADANYDFTKIKPSSVTGLESPGVQAASDHIQQYFTQVCHLTPPTS